MKKCISYLCLIAILFGCKKDDFKATKTDNFTWNINELRLLEINSINSDVYVESAVGDVINAEVNKICYDQDEDIAKANLAENYFLDSLTTYKLTLNQHVNCSSCDCRNEIKVFPLESMQYEINVTEGNISIWHMNTTGVIVNDNGGIYISNNRGSINLKATASITCDYEYAIAGDTIIISTTSGNVLLSLPRDVSANIDCETTFGEVSIIGFENMAFSTNESAKKIVTIGNAVAKVQIRIEAEPISGVSNIEIFDR